MRGNRSMSKTSAKAVAFGGIAMLIAASSFAGLVLPPGVVLTLFGMVTLFAVFAGLAGFAAVSAVAVGLLAVPASLVGWIWLAAPAVWFASVAIVAADVAVNDYYGRKGA